MDKLIFHTCMQPLIRKSKRRTYAFWLVPFSVLTRDNFLGVSAILAKEKYTWYLLTEKYYSFVFCVANQEIGKSIITIAVE
jgi:hypothetical protein